MLTSAPWDLQAHQLSSWQLLALQPHDQGSASAMSYMSPDQLAKQTDRQAAEASRQRPTGRQVTLDGSFPTANPWHITEAGVWSIGSVPVGPGGIHALHRQVPSLSQRWAL
eukprot:116705-Chlamydomonas_euryale.AAC.2